MSAGNRHLPRLCLGLALVSSTALALDDAGAPPSPFAAAPSAAIPSAGAAPSGAVVGDNEPTTSLGSCTEHLPDGKGRPEMKETFPTRGKAGHHATLELEIRHGSAVRVLPGALQVQRQDKAAKFLESVGFAIPSERGPGRPRVKRTESETGAKTVVQLSFLPLPKEPGRHELTLPPLPIAMARASGEVITICTQPHTIVVEDPTANTPNAKPKANPEPQRQRELHEFLRNAVYGGAVALAVAALVLWAYSWWRRRPKPVPPPPPPRPPWEIAFESFEEIRRAKLIENAQLSEHYERVTHTLRRYLGDRFGFDGLESTTREIMEHLAKAPEADAIRLEAELFLNDSDLIKFAKVEPTEAQCSGVLQRSEDLVRRSMPTALGERPSSPGAPTEMTTGGGSR